MYCEALGCVEDDIFPEVPHGVIPILINSVLAGRWDFLWLHRRMRRRLGRASLGAGQLRFLRRLA
jgi:hypothetical protein